MENLTKRRLNYLDYAKGIGILLVVLGHIYNNSVKLWIYSFHMPLFFIISGYLLEYNKTYDILNFELSNGKNTIYISQQQQFNEIATGIVNEEDKCAEVNNSHVDQKIEIYESIQDGSVVFNVKKNHVFLCISGKVSIDEAKKIAENIEFR